MTSSVLPGGAVADGMAASCPQGASASPVPALPDSEATYRTLVEATGTGYVILDAEGRVLDANAEYVRLTGHQSLAEVTGRPVTEWTAPHDLERNAAEVRKCVERGSVRHLEVDYVDGQGHITPIEVSATVVGVGAALRIVTLCRDISNRRRAQSALQASERQYRSTIDAMEEAVHVVDRDLRLVLANQTYARWCQKLGLAGIQAGQLLRDVFPFLPVKVFDEYEQVFATGKALATEEVTCVGGIDVVTETRKIPLVEEGVVCRVVTVVRDVTVLRQAETERRALEERVRQAQKLESLGVLAGGIAHDFNNLLTVILGHADLAIGELPPGSDIHLNLTRIAETSRRASELCRQMLAYAGRAPSVIEPLDLSRLAQEAADMLRVSVSKRAVLGYRLEEGLPAIRADAAQIRQVVMNLVINASEAIGEREGTITVTTGVTECDGPRLRGTRGAETLAPGTYVYLQVSDTGCGMDAQTLERIFDPFFTTKFAGRGLGLAMVLGIVRNHGGTVEVTTQPGQGSTMTVLFPATEGSPGLQPSAPPAEPWQGSGLILVVDDEEPVRDVARRVLERSGFTIITAGDGCEALNRFREHAREIVCVLLDLTMPRMDGAQALRELRCIDKSVPVIMASGYGAPPSGAGPTEGGPDGFVQKPFRAAELRAMVRSVLSHRRAP